MPVRPTREQRKKKLEISMEVMPLAYEKKISTIKDKADAIHDATDVIVNNVLPVLDEAGIYGTSRIDYLNYARRVYRATLTYRDVALANRVRALREAVLREYPHLRPEVLERIEQKFLAGTAGRGVAGGVPAGT